MTIDWKKLQGDMDAITTKASNQTDIQTVSNKSGDLNLAASEITLPTLTPEEIKAQTELVAAIEISTRKNLQTARLVSRLGKLGTNTLNIAKKYIGP